MQTERSQSGSTQELCGLLEIACDCVNCPSKSSFTSKLDTRMRCDEDCTEKTFEQTCF